MAAKPESWKKTNTEYWELQKAIDQSKTTEISDNGETHKTRLCEVVKTLSSVRKVTETKGEANDRGLHFLVILQPQEGQPALRMYVRIVDRNRPEPIRHSSIDTTQVITFFTDQSDEDIESIFSEKALEVQSRAVKQ